jgi:hypothetical protein
MRCYRGHRGRGWEHTFVTSQGSAYGRLRRALDTGNATIALAAAVAALLLAPAGFATGGGGAVAARSR